jgi:hypothetical protein
VTVGQDAPNPNGPLPDPTADPGAIETGAATAIPTDNRPSSRSFLFFDRTQSVFGEDLRIRHGHVAQPRGIVNLHLCEAELLKHARSLRRTRATLAIDNAFLVGIGASGPRTINRIKGLLFAQGIRDINVKSRYKTLAVDKLVTGDGHRLLPRLACGERLAY